MEYFYDSNGNLVKNLDNKIQRIKYNVINLPEVVAFSDRNLLTFYYMADGRKVRDTYGSYPTGTSTPLDDIVNNTDPYISGTNDWCEDYYYESGKLRRVTLPEGHISLYDNRKGPIMKYSAKDHVGSIRGYWKPGDTSLVKSYYPTYYPSGILDNKTDPYHPFALGGKELIMRNQLDDYFFGARTMYAMFNRFNQVDPLCEKYYSWSPYVYSFNNPVRYVDPNGKDGWDVIAGYGIGLITNIIPGSGGLRDQYAPNDPSDYNNALQGVDYASVLVGDGMIKTGGTGAALGAGAVAVGVTVTAGSGGTLAVGGVPVASAGVALIKAGATTAGAGAVLMANGKQNQEAGYNRGKKNEVTFTQGEGADAKKITVKIPDGYKKINERSKHSMPIYSNGKDYISPDKYAHNGGIWKKANSVKELKSRTTRLGTYDKDLNRIGD